MCIIYRFYTICLYMFDMISESSISQIVICMNMCNDPLCSIIAVFAGLVVSN